MRVLILGPLEVVDDDGAAVVLNGPKLRSLTALLALDAGRTVSTDRLIDALYGEDQPSCAENALQLQVSKLRRVLRAGCAGTERAVVTRPPGYALDLAPADVDALHFERLVAEARACVPDDPTAASERFHRALDLWRGPALADLAFDDVATGDRVRLEELRLSTLEDCIDVDLELGRHTECVDRLERLVAEHPLRERPWGQLMIALYRDGRQAESLRTFERARRHLAEELGIDPGPELRRLEAAVLAQDPHLLGPAPAASAAVRAVDRPLTACIGREQELADVGALLDSHRLVTLVGPGGTGKTRVAVEVALARGGAALVDLAAVTDARGVEAAVRAALGGGGAPPLVLVDNCEQVVAEAARAIADLLSGLPYTTVLATSREVLGVPGEVLYPVPPLAPDAAVALFTERAHAGAPGSDLDADAVFGICARLDGLPLAIELAAARVRALGVAQVSARLGRRFQLLTAGPRTLLPRQRTLRAVVDWSYDLLDGQERLLFERLSVFPTGAGIDAVEEVCGGAGIAQDDVAAVLCRLVDKSLVTAVRGRYTMLQTLAEYAAERLGAGDATDELRRRHARWMLGLVRLAERGAGAPGAIPLPELDAEAEGLDAAFAWAWENDRPLALELAARLGWFWFWSGRIEHGWRTLHRCLDRRHETGDALRARLCAWGGMLCAVVQATGSAALVDEAVASARASGEPGVVGQALTIRAALAALQGRPAEAVADLDEGATCYQAAGDGHGLGVTSMLRGMAARSEGRFDEAESWYSRSVAFFRAAGEDWAAGVPLQRIAELAEHRRDTGAGRLYESVVRSQLASGGPGGVRDLADAVAHHLRGRAALQGDRPEDARDDLELALASYRKQGSPAAAAACLCDLARVALAAGRVDEVVAMAEEAAAEAAGAVDPSAVVAALDVLAAALGGRGQVEAAALVAAAGDLLPRTVAV